MKQCIKITTLAALLLAAITTSAAAKRFLTTKEIKRGMVGYGLTVFQGTKIEKFKVKILGVLFNNGAKSDLILAELSGGPLHKTGVIAGMSGSPVYINGKMIGAVAYAWGFSKSTIAGIQPIQQMMEVFSYHNKKKNRRFKIYKKEGTTINGQKISSAQNSYSFRPVATPLIFSGVKPAVFNLLAPTLKDNGFIPVLGGGAGKKIESKTRNMKFKPGSAIGVQLVGGDISMTGIGTVTYTGPEGILAFGHPMMRRGHCSFPMTTAYIHTLMPNLRVSFKLGSALQVIGSIHQDRNAAIAGTYNKKASMMPIKIQFNLGKQQKKYNFTMIRDELLFYRLFPAVMMNTLIANSSEHGRLSYKIKYAFKILEEKSGKIHVIKVKNMLASFSTARGYYTSIAKLVKSINSILFNSFKGVSLAGIDVKIEATSDIQAIEIKELRCDQKKVRPGDTVKINVKLKPYQGKAFWKKISIKVPESTVNKKIFFVVSSANHERYYDRFFSPTKYKPFDLEGMIKIMNTERDSSELVVWSELYRHGLIINGKHLPNLPKSFYKILAQSSAQQKGHLNARLRKIYKTNYFLYGLKFIILEMDHSNYN